MVPDIQVSDTLGIERFYVEEIEGKLNCHGAPSAGLEVKDSFQGSSKNI